MRDETEGRSEGLRGRPQLRLCPIGDGEIGGGFRAAEGCVCVCVCVCEEHRGWAGLGAGRKAGLTIQNPGDLSDPRIEDLTQVSCITGRFFTI